MSGSIVWFRHDLRLRDHPALSAAAREERSVIPLYIWSPESEWRRPLGPASVWWLRNSLAALDEQLRGRGSRLILRAGQPHLVLPEIARETGAKTVHWNGSEEPDGQACEDRVNKALREQGVLICRHDPVRLFEPGMIRTGEGRPYRVFTSFWKACLRAPEPPPVPIGKRPLPPARWPRSLAFDELAPDTDSQSTALMERIWSPGEAGAAKRLRIFLDRVLSLYPRQRDRIDLDGTSRLSSHLRFGEITARQVWHAVHERAADRDRSVPFGSAEVYLRQLLWREFAYHLLHHFPQIPDHSMRPEFDRIRWRRSTQDFEAWCEGRTGFPIVDAGMRQLRRTGWIHNRVRMIVGSFLVKDLLIDWRLGAQWFWDRLVDADLANNTLGWQWVAGCGVDAAPFFRIFNPVVQGERFDPEGTYVRRSVPELARLPSRLIHRPWVGSREDLEAAGIHLGRNYPKPIVDHASARGRALAAFASARGGGRHRGSGAA